MSDLRHIVRKHVEDETLKLYLGARYQRASKVERKRLLDVLDSRGEIHREVDKIIGGISSAPDRKGLVALEGARAVCVILVGYGVNKEFWPLVTGVALIDLLITGFRVYRGH